MLCINSLIWNLARPMLARHPFGCGALRRQLHGGPPGATAQEKSLLRRRLFRLETLLQVTVPPPNASIPDPSTSGGPRAPSGRAPRRGPGAGRPSGPESTHGAERPSASGQESRPPFPRGAAAVLRRAAAVAAASSRRGRAAGAVPTTVVGPTSAAAMTARRTCRPVNFSRKPTSGSAPRPTRWPRTGLGTTWRKRHSKEAFSEFAL